MRGGKRRYDVVVRNHLKLAAHAFDDAQDAVQNAHIVVATTGHEILHHGGPLDVIVLETHLDQT